MPDMKAAALLLLLLPGACTRREQPNSPITGQESPAAPQEFQTAGAQEDAWAREFFCRYYAYHEYPRFSGRVAVEGPPNDLRLIFGPDTLRLGGCDAVMSLIFREGLVYPKVADEYLFRDISSVAELPNATESPQRRRFSCWVWDAHSLNPTTYLFELRNAQATAATDTRTFIQGATLTFIREGWGVL